jgi:hypothetical protein
MSVTVCNTCDALLCLGVLSVGNRSLYLEDGAPMLAGDLFDVVSGFGWMIGKDWRIGVISRKRYR